MQTEEYCGIIEKIIRDGKHGPYAVISSEVLGPVTMALDQSVWRESEWPDPGTYVIFSQVIKKRAGWRTKQGRFLQPSDEK